MQATYLLLHVVEGVGRVDGEADEDHVGVGVGQRAQAVVVFLACRVPQRQLDVLAIDLDIGHVVLEDGGDVDLRRDRSAAGLPGLQSCAEDHPRLLDPTGQRILEFDDGLIEVRERDRGLAHFGESALGENTVRKVD